VIVEGVEQSPIFADRPFALPDCGHAAISDLRAISPQLWRQPDLEKYGARHNCERSIQRCGHFTVAGV
jgi:hypothetical protein